MEIFHPKELYLLLTIVAMVVVPLILFGYWVSAFVKMMLLTESDFSTKYDNILWFIIFILFNVAGAFIFSYWYSKMIRIKRVEARRQAIDTEIKELSGLGFKSEAN